MGARQWAVVGTTTMGLVGGTVGLAWATVPTGPQADLVVARDCGVQAETLTVDLDASGLEPNQTYSLYLQSEQFPPGFDNLRDFPTDVRGQGSLEWVVVTSGVTDQDVVVDWEVVDLRSSEMTTVVEDEYTALACTSTSPSSSASATATTTTATTTTVTTTTATATTTTTGQPTTAPGTTASATSSPTTLPTSTAAGVPATPTTSGHAGTAPARATPVLASTGAPVMGVALLGGLLVVGGGAALLAARRRAD